VFLVMGVMGRVLLGPVTPENRALDERLAAADAAYRVRQAREEREAAQAKREAQQTHYCQAWTGVYLGQQLDAVRVVDGEREVLVERDGERAFLRLLTAPSVPAPR
jgi:hypothetical protein